MLSSHKFAIFRVHNCLKCSSLNLCRTKTKLASKEVTVWQSVIGLEVHAQIQADSKLFSCAASKYGEPVNQQVSFLDMAMPGTLPKLNKRCVEAGVLTSLALNCKVNPVSKFDRKHYFYADLPAGYQITQQREPLGVGGSVHFACGPPGKVVEKSVRLIQLQLEQDSGKSLHDTDANVSLIDLNRAGVALMEIVTEPDFTTGEEATGFVRELSQIFLRIGTCNAKMEEGSMRVDASISLHKPGTPLGTRCEVKNIGSARCVARAIEYEIKRQKQVLESGGEVVNQTRNWDQDLGKTIAMRDKEKLHDYRFMPEPNLPPLRLGVDETMKSASDIVNVDELRRSLPVLPGQDRDRLCERHGVSMEHAYTIVDKPGFLELFDTLMEVSSRDSKKLCLFLLLDLSEVLNKENVSWSESTMHAKDMADIFDLRESGEITLVVSQLVLKQAARGFSGLTVRGFINKKTWWRITDIDYITIAINDILNENNKSVHVWGQGGKKADKALTYLIKQVLIKYDGRISPQDMKPILVKRMQVLTTRSRAGQYLV